MFADAKIKCDCNNILSVKRLGIPKPNKIQPVLLRLSEPKLKKVIFPAAKFIRSKHNISIDNDFSPPQREELYQVRCARRSLIRNNIECHIRGFDMIINAVHYNWKAALRYMDNNLAARNMPPPGEQSSAGQPIAAQEGDKKRKAMRSPGGPTRGNNPKRSNSFSGAADQNRNLEDQEIEADCSYPR